jgi:hypothetical protein
LVTSINNILSTALADAINNTQLSFNPSIVDVFIWPHNKNGVYTTKSGYNWLLSHHEADNQTGVSWNWIWRINVPEKIKFLIWLTCHNVAPTRGRALHGLGWTTTHPKKLKN